MIQSLATAEDRTQLLANGRTRVADHDTDSLPVVRLFTPDAHATWLLVSIDPADGLIGLGLGMPELGYVKLPDLASIVGPLKQPVLRDVYFQATRTLSDYARLAQANGSIVD